MKTQVYTVFDSKVEAYLLPFYALTDAAAVRMFANAVQTPDHSFHSNPEDFTLFKLGVFDQSSARFVTQTPLALGVGVQYVNWRPPAQLDLEDAIAEETR